MSAKRRPVRSLVLPGAVLALALLLTGCGGGATEEADSSATSSASAATQAGTAPIAPEDALQRIADGARVLDVRTPEEFDAGHLDGSVNIDATAADFGERIADLPREQAYLVYCATGNRATGAVEQMLDLGFTDVVNGGGYDDLR